MEDAVYADVSGFPAGEQKGGWEVGGHVKLLQMKPGRAEFVTGLMVRNVLWKKRDVRS